MTDYPLGEWTDAPVQEQQDGSTGIKYSILTGSVGNNTHIYFNRENFTADSKQLIFRSDRTGSWQVYAYDIARERMRRLTDAALDPARPSIDPCKPLLYYTQGNKVLQLNIDTLEEKTVYEHPTPEDGTFMLMDISGDGQYLGFMEIGPYDKLEDGPADFVRRFEAKPLSSFWISKVDGSKSWKAHEEERHIQHLLFNPTDPKEIMYCHEGPWDRVQQRLWLMDWHGEGIRPLRVQEKPELAIGHEYWCADGQHVDYIRRGAGEPTAVCRIDTETNQETVLTEHHFSHFICNRSGELIVGDDPDNVTLLDVATGELTPLVQHNQELNIANTLFHPHPAFSPDGQKIVFCAKDQNGCNNVCLLEMRNI